MSDMVRFGRVSKIIAASGRMEVVYEDREDSVTDEIGMISNRCFCLPKVGDIVAVLHNANGAEEGMVLGTLWNDENPPPEGKEKLFREDMDQEPGICFRRWDANKKEYHLQTEGDETREVKKGQDIKVKESRKVEVGKDLTETVKGSVQRQVVGDSTLQVDGSSVTTVEGELILNVNGSLTIQVGECSVKIGGGSIVVNAPAVKIDGSGGDVNVNGVSLANHTHKYSAPLHPQGVVESAAPTK